MRSPHDRARHGLGGRMMPCAGLRGACWQCPCSGTLGGPVRRQARVASNLNLPVNRALQESTAKAAGSGLGAARRRGRAHPRASTARRR